VLVSEATDPTARARLEAARDLRDGFELAERDWELRREGDVLGLVQSGLPRSASPRSSGRATASLQRLRAAAAEALLDDAAGCGRVTTHSRGSSRPAGWRGSPRPSRRAPHDEGSEGPCGPRPASSHRGWWQRRPRDRRRARGRRLAAPGAGTRPLSDRVKQSLFAIIEPDIRDHAFLDLFAGSGAGGIEALSRGAERAVFVGTTHRPST
jgi:hypothetical protein